MNFVSSSSKFFHRWLFSNNRKYLLSFLLLLIVISLFFILMVFTEGIFITYAYAMGKTDPAVGTFTIMSLQQVPCESISEFSSSMNSLISEPTPAQSGNGHQRFIKVTASVVNTEGMSMFQKMAIQAMPSKCFLALGELTK